MGYDIELGCCCISDDETRYIYKHEFNVCFGTVKYFGDEVPEDRAQLFLSREEDFLHKITLSFQAHVKICLRLILEKKKNIIT